MMDVEFVYIVMAYIVLVNLAAFVVFGIDKWKAGHRRWRISEATLLMSAVVGGSLGAWLGMKVWRHKTLHCKFRYGVPAILVLQVAIILYLFGDNLMQILF